MSVPTINKPWLSGGTSLRSGTTSNTLSSSRYDELLGARRQSEAVQISPPKSPGQTTSNRRPSVTLTRGRNASVISIKNQGNGGRGSSRSGPVSFGIPVENLARKTSAARQRKAPISPIAPPAQSRSDSGVASAGGVLTAGGGGMTGGGLMEASPRKMSDIIREVRRSLPDVALEEGSATVLSSSSQVSPGNAFGSAIMRRQRGNRGIELGVIGGAFLGAREKTAEELFRGVHVFPGHPVCSDPEAVSSEQAKLWSRSAFTEQAFSLSQPVDRVDWFVSHTWTRDRRDPMFLNDDEFAAYKAVELEGAIAEIVAQRRRTSNTSLGGLRTMSPDDVAGAAESEERRVTMWIDKFCVPPDYLERRVVVERHMDHFMRHSDGLLVLPSTAYFRRLWCVYEWGVFVATHGHECLDGIRICLTWLCGNELFQIPIVARDIQFMSIKVLKCTEDNDKTHLRGLIETRFRSVDRFQEMVQISALCSFGKTCAVLALDFCTPGSPDLEDEWRVFNRHLSWRYSKFVAPWRSAAEKLGFVDVCQALDRFWDQAKRAGKMGAEGQQEEGSALFCVSSPAGNRLHALVNTAATVHLSSVVKTARAAALPKGGYAFPAAICVQPSLLSTAASKSRGKGAANIAVCGGSSQAEGGGSGVGRGRGSAEKSEESDAGVARRGRSSEWWDARPSMRKAGFAELERGDTVVDDSGGGRKVDAVRKSDSDASVKSSTSSRSSSSGNSRNGGDVVSVGYG